jgi:hypothetical protein
MPAPTRGDPETCVNTLKFIWLTLVQLVKETPGTITKGYRQWQSRRPPTPRQIEAERIDRIRFPAKYRGK